MHHNRKLTTLYIYTVGSFHLYSCTPLYTHTLVHLYICNQTLVHLYRCTPIHLHTHTRVHLNTCTPLNNHTLVHLNTCTPLYTITLVHLYTSRVHPYISTPVHPLTCTPEHLYCTYALVYLYACKHLYTSTYFSFLILIMFSDVHFSDG